MNNNKKIFFEKIIFGIGSNLLDREKNLKVAVELLKENLALKNLKISKIFQNQALLPENSPPEWNIDFLNIAVSAEIEISPELICEGSVKSEFFEKILQIAKEIEQKIGRKKRARWAPREIDIDILAIGFHQISLNNLQIPHKGTFEREFFIKTFSEIEPEFFQSALEFFVGK